MLFSVLLECIQLEITSQNYLLTLVYLLFNYVVVRKIIVVCNCKNIKLIFMHCHTVKKNVYKILYFEFEFEILHNVLLFYL